MSIRQEIFFSLNHLRQSIHTVTFYPDYSDKSIGKEAILNIAAHLHIHDRIPFEYSTRGLEYLYHHTGVRLTGITELRWAWKYNDLKPRIYYARGPELYYDAKYIQQLFNLLIDTIPVCHKRERYFTSTIKLTDEELFFIYDYESFTSCLEEVKRFCRALGIFFNGYHSTFIDTFRGPESRDVGDMILLWNETCNNYPSFDSGKAKWDRSEQEFQKVNHSCGMLGVPGNISSCTLLHSFHLAILLVSLLCKVVGDDAGGSCLEEDFPSIFKLLKNIGKVEQSKTVEFPSLSWSPELESTNDRPWHYLKRPINRIDNIVVTGSQVIWPSSGMILNNAPSYRRGVQVVSKRDLRRKTANALCFLVKQLRDHPLTEEEDRLARAFLDWAIRTSHLSREVDSSGALASYEVFYPTTLDTWMTFDSAMQVYSHRIVVLPDEEGQLSEEINPCQPLLMRSSKALKLAKDLGYVTMTPRYKRCFGKDDPELFERIFLGERISILYDVYILEDIPSWMLDLIRGMPSILDSKTIMKIFFRFLIVQVMGRSRLVR